MFICIYLWNGIPCCLCIYCCILYLYVYTRLYRDDLACDSRCLCQRIEQLYWGEKFPLVIRSHPFIGITFRNIGTNITSFEMVCPKNLLSQKSIFLLLFISTLNQNLLKWSNYHYCYYKKMSAVQGRGKVIYTLSVRRPQPHNTEEKMKNSRRL